MRQYTKTKTRYPFPSLVNNKTDRDNWEIKKINAAKSGGRVKFKVDEHTRFIPDTCPHVYDPIKLNIYFRSIMYSKLQFKKNHGCRSQVTEEQFIQIWLKRLEQDSGYAANMRTYVQDQMGIHITVAGIIESLQGC